ncbi:MAG: hypothetical protein Q4Q04_04005 [Methanocorpusculum sp.]|nr:hypothetical protein [Methanocorpusculum sp.]
MSAGELYRIEFRVQNSIKKYYLFREIYSDARKFTASRLIKSGTAPTRTEINRCAALYGFDLELACVQKAARFRTENFTFEQYDDADAVFELEKYRCLFARKMALAPYDYTPAYIASAEGVTLTAAEIEKLFSSGTIPRGKTLSEINRVQNLHNACRMRGGAKPLTAAQVWKLQAVLSANLPVVHPPAAGLRRPVEKLLRTYAQNIRQGFHPFEQSVYLARGMLELMPDETLLAGEIFARTAAKTGYVLFPTPDFAWEDAVSYARRRNPVLELEVRTLNADRFKVRAGGRQKQLEFV